MSGSGVSLQTRRVASADGAQIEYDTAVLASGRSARVFIHGWGCRRDFWAAQLEHFGGDAPLVALDLAGHGASSAGERGGGGGTGGWTIEAFARDVVATLDAEGLREVIAIGHSMGGAVAVEVARLAPTRVRAVVAVDALTYPTVYPRVAEEIVRQSMDAFRRDFRAAIEATMDPVFSPAIEPALRAQILDALESTPREPGIESIGALLRWDGVAAIAACPAPIHGLVAEAFFDREAVANYVDQLEIETLPGVGHFLMLEDPTGFNTALRRLLQRIE